VNLHFYLQFHTPTDLHCLNRTAFPEVSPKCSQFTVICVWLLSISVLLSFMIARWLFVGFCCHLPKVPPKYWDLAFLLHPRLPGVRCWSNLSGSTWAEPTLSCPLVPCSISSPELCSLNTHLCPLISHFVWPTCHFITSLTETAFLVMN
jgi:hypothetical protein